MIAAQSSNPLTPEDYLEHERHSTIKHEYINGEVYAMAGTGGFHNIISGNVYMLLRNHLHGSQCRTYFADMKVKLAEGKQFFYPDLVITCAQDDDPSRAYITQPKLIIEVLSESTELFDRGKKFHYYRTIPSLQEYILISSQEYLVDIFRRTEDDLWMFESYQGEGAIAQFHSLDLNAPLAEIYATLDLSPKPSP